MEPATELGMFLRRKREQTPPTAAGRAAGSGRRTPGLRREEVALHSGVGLTWYTWLEQGRAAHPSREVLGAVAATLAMTPAEHQYILRLAGHDDTPPQPPTEFPEHGQRLLDALGVCPAYAITWDWTVVAWNAAYAALYSTIATTALPERNLLWLVWTDPAVRHLLGDWHTDRQRFVAMYRSDLGPRINTPQVEELVQRLSQADHDFAATWQQHHVDGFVSRVRSFHHPHAGDLQLEHHQLGLPDAPGTSVVVYTPSPGHETSLAQLAPATTRSSGAFR